MINFIYINPNQQILDINENSFIIKTLEDQIAKITSPFEIKFTKPKLIDRLVYLKNNK